MGRIKGFIRAAALALLPARIGRLIANRMGYAIAPGTRIGLSWIQVARLEMAPGSNIGHFNIVKGPFDVELVEHAALGHMNTILGPPRPDVGTRSHLKLGIWAKITHSHHLDMTDSVAIGDYSTIAGAGSQLWTHGYVHDAEGIGRYRVDGEIEIANNVSVGSGAIITQGVRIGPGITIGAGTVVAKDLTEPGFYVTGAVRHLPRPQAPELRADLEPISPGDVDGEDRVFRRLRDR